MASNFINTLIPPARAGAESPLRRVAVLLTLAALTLAPVLARAAWFSKSSDSDVPSQRIEIESGGLQRTYQLYVPQSYNGKPVPLLVALHPALATGALMEKVSHFDALADANNFIVAYPDGISKRWNAGSCCGPPMEQHVDDMAFVDEMVHQITSKYAIDPARHYVAGFSNGAFLAHHIACQEPNDFAAYAVVAGTITTTDCRGARPTPFMIIQGNRDTEVPWDGGTKYGGYRPAIPEVIKRLSVRNHCSGGETVVDSTPPAMCKRFNGCGADFTYCVLDGVGHQWPGSGKAVWSMLLGPNTDKFNASERMWAFFRDQGNRQ